MYVQLFCSFLFTGTDNPASTQRPPALHLFRIWTHGSHPFAYADRPAHDQLSGLILLGVLNRDGLRRGLIHPHLSFSVHHIKPGLEQRNTLPRHDS